MITGEFRVASTNRIEGWAYSTEADGEHLLIEIFIDGRLRASIIADTVPNERFLPEGLPSAGSFSVSFERPFSEAQLSGTEVLATALTGEREALSRRGAGLPIQPSASPRGRPADLAALTWPFPMPTKDAGPLVQPALQIAIATERLGLRFFASDGWLGSRGLHLPIGGFAVRRIGPPNEAIVEIKGIMSDGEATAWIAEGKLCGRRDGHRALTGFAVRARGPGCKFVYAGRFASGEATLLRRDGEVCASQRAHDPLTAVQIRLSRCDTP